MQKEAGYPLLFYLVRQKSGMQISVLTAKEENSLA